ncbi:MAG: hypothetical protein IT299_01110 [Dehalococcoidia bacterium]|nr:hypothetical protein [Dehalococcoidia bacterium]
MSWSSYPKYRDSGLDWLGPIPHHWQVKRLKYVTSYQTSTVDKKATDDEVAVKLCNYTDVYAREEIRPDDEFMDATATLAEVRKFGLRVGDVVITKDSEDWRDIAVPAIVVETAADLVCGYHLGIYRVDKRVLLPTYLFRALQSHAVNHQFQIESNGVTRYGLPNAAASGAFIPLPPVDEQIAIAQFLSRELARIALLAESTEVVGPPRGRVALLVERLQEYRTAVITAAITGKIDVRDSAREAMAVK